MKTILTTMALAFCLTINAQTVILGSVSLTQNSSFNNSGLLEANSYNCGGILTGEITINGDLNLNGYTLYLKQGTTLKVNGNLNGGGQIKSCNSGNNNNISVCVTGATQNSPNLNGLSCNLSLPSFDINKDFNHYFQIYNLLGQKLKEGMTNLEMYNGLPKGEVLLVNIEGFKGFKTIIK